jgi:hypothetical protein
VIIVALGKAFISIGIGASGIGIVLFAFAMKKIIGHVDEELDSVAAFALCGGSALYRLTYSAMRVRTQRRVTVSAAPAAPPTRERLTGAAI